MLGRPNGVMESQSLISSFHTESFKIHCERAVNRVERERERGHRYIPIDPTAISSFLFVMELQKSHESKAKTLVFFVLLSCLLFSGVIFGFAPLLLMLESEGVYAELCKKEATPCPMQEDRLNLCFVLATFILSFMSLPTGIFLDTYGPQKTLIVSAVLTSAGLCGMAYADSRKLDIFLPSFVALASGGVMILLSAFPSSFLLPKYQAGIIAGFSCLFDASSIVFSVFNQLHDSYGITRKSMFLVYAITCVLMMIPPIYLWGDMEKILDQNNRGTDEAEHLLKTDGYREKNLQEGGVGFHANSGDTVLIPEMRLALADTESMGSYGGLPRTSSKNRSIPVLKRSFLGQLKSFEYVFIVTFAAVQMLRANTYLGSVVELLDSYGDGNTENNHFYSKVFSYVLPAGIFCVPIIDYSINRFGLTGSLLLTTIFGGTFSSISLINNLRVQIISFATFTIFRAFLYAILTTYNAQVFGLETLGRITGTVFTSCSLVGLAQYPLIDMTHSIFHGKFSVLFYILTGLTIPMLILIFKLHRHRRSKQNGSPILKRRSSSIMKSGGSTPLEFSPSYSGRFPGFHTPLTGSSPKKNVVEEYFCEVDAPQTI